MLNLSVSMIVVYGPIIFIGICLLLAMDASYGEQERSGRMLTVLLGFGCILMPVTTIVWYETLLTVVNMLLST